ncbi:MAG: MaoC family dehydratase N-terminal domain-containing protein [Myxococcota bacterium]
MGRRERRHPQITEAGLAALRGRLKVRIEDTLEPWCTEATRDAIRHYAHGIGDDNPLWCDPEYAARSTHGGIVAPPSFVFACDRIISGYVGGLPGVHAMWAGSDFRWHRWIRLGDRIHTESRLEDVIEHETRFSGRAIQQVYHTDFHDGEGKLICEAESWCFRTERDTAREEGTKYDELKQRAPKRYSADELEEIYALYEGEEVRGATSRFFEQVEVGETLPRIVKGPMTVTGFIAFVQGWGGLYIRSNKLAWRQVRTHSGLGIPNRFGIPDCPERVHWEDEFAREVGAPAAYDYGPERASWMTHQITNWMGDEGFLHRHRCEIRRHNPVGDTLFLDGEVSRKFVDEGQPSVEIRQRAVNQDGELSVQASAVVRLPVRGRTAPA